MVSFRSLVIAAFAIPALAVTSPKDVSNNINSLTMKSQSLIEPAQSLTILNGPLVVAGQGPLPKIILGFGDIITTATGAFAQMQGMPKVAPGADSDLIFDSFREFVRIHQILLNTLIGKAGLFTTVPFVGAPVAAVLRQIEKIVDTLAFTLIDTLQGRMTEVKAQGDMLDATVEQGIKAFGGVNVMDTLGGLLNPGMSSMPAQPAAPMSMAPAASMAPVPAMMSSIVSNMMPQASGNPMMQSMLSSMMPTAAAPAATPASMAAGSSPMNSSMPTSAPSGAMPNGVAAPSGASPSGMMPSGVAAPSGASPSGAAASPNNMMSNGTSPSGVAAPSGASPSSSSPSSGIPTIAPASPSDAPNGAVMMPLGSMPMDGSAFIIQATGENIVCSCSNGPSSRVKRSALAF